MENILDSTVGRWRRELRGTFSNNSPTVPQWELDLEKGDDGGYFGPGSAAWAVHGSMTTLVAGIQSLLIQALHPGAMAGVHDFSRYRDDPIGRLTGTVRWIICVTYGSTAQAARETQRVARLHERVEGSYESAAGERAYSAADADLVEWVHLAFTEAFLGAHQRWGGPIPGGPDAYVREWAQAGRLMRLENPPLTEAELLARMDGFFARGELRRDERVDDVVRFLRAAPFTGVMRIAYRVLFAAAVASLPRSYRRLLGLRRSLLPVVTLTRIVLAVSAKALEEGPRAQDFARQRLRRLSGTPSATPGATAAH